MLILLCLLGASVPLKAWTISAPSSTPRPEIAAELARFLGEDGFTIRYEHDLLGYPAVIGLAGSCRVWLGTVAADGWHRDIVASNASARTEVAFFFRGRPYADQPVWSTWMHDKTHWFSGAFTGSSGAAPVVAALLDHACTIDRKRWADRLDRL
jgi:hypothetical protein